MVASLHYINRHHDLKTLGPTDTIRPEKKGDENQPPQEGMIPPTCPPYPNTQTNVSKVEPYPTEIFRKDQKELAQDLVVKEQQIELIISNLPGLKRSEQNQEEEIRLLEEELKLAEVRRMEAVKEKEAVLEKLEAVIRSVKRP